MKRIFSAILSAVIVLGQMNFALAESKRETVEIYVSPNGADTADGTAEKPLKSVMRAKERACLLKKHNPNSDIVVNFFGGDYPVSDTVTFDIDDRGSEDGKIIFRAYNDEEVNFTNAIRVKASDFEYVTDPKIKERIPEAARERMVRLNLGKVGIQKLDKFEAWLAGKMNSAAYAMLFVDGDKQELSRWPNDGYVKTGRIIDGGSASGSGYYGGESLNYKSNGRGFEFKFDDSRIEKWREAKDFMLEGYLVYDYFFGAYNVAAVDADTRTIKTVQGANGGAAVENRRWAVRNLLEEADVPGEYYIDYENNYLYLNPPYGMKDASVELVVADNVMIRLENTGYVEFSGINFQKNRNTAVEIYKSNHVGFKDCTFSQIGGRGIIAYQSTYVTAENCEFSHIGGMGVYISGGDRENLVSSGNVIDNCVFTCWGDYQKTYEPGISLSDVGAKVTNNVFHNAPFSAVMFEGNDNVISHNEIYNVLDGLNDGGAIYFGLSMTWRGNEISYNYIHDLFPGLHGDASLICGIYLDDTSSGSSVHHNVIKDATYGIIATGRDNEIYSNIVSVSNAAISGDNRGESWMLNSFYNSDGSINYSGRPLQQLTGVNYKGKAYAKYPHLQNILEDEIKMNIPAYNSCYDNIVLGGKISLTDSFVKYGIKIGNNYDAVSKDEFEDFDGECFKLKSDSQLYEKVPETAKIDVRESGREYENDSVSPRLFSPAKGAQNVNPDGIIFKWSRVEGADKYRIKVATDKEMKNVVFEETTTARYVITSALEAGEKTYYWTVDAEDLGLSGYCREYAEEPNSFTTSYYKEYDKEEIKALQKEYMSVLSGMKIGDGIGEYTNELYSEASEMFSQLRAMAENPAATDTDVRNTAERAENMLQKIRAGAKPGYTNLSERTASSDWSLNTTVGEDEVKVGTGYSVLTKKLSDNEIFCFEMSGDLEKENKEFIIRANSREPDVTSKLFKAYAVSLGKDEIRLFKYADGEKTLLSTAPNKYIQDAAAHEIRVGASVLNSSIKVVLYIDNEMVFAYKDLSSPLCDIGYFAAKGSMSLFAAKAIPEEEYDPLANDYPEPYVLDMKELLSSKDNWGASGDFEIVDGVLKTAPGTKIYTKDIIEQNAVVKFMGKFNPGTSWIGIGVKNSEPTKDAWSGDTYLMCLKPATIEVQTFNKLKSLFYCIQKAEIDWEEWHEYTISSYETEKGVKVRMEIDGKVYLDYDDETPITAAGHLVFFDYAKKGFEIKPID